MNSIYENSFGEIKSRQCGLHHKLKESGQAKPVSINTELAKAYFKPLAELSAELKLDTSSILSSLLKMPEVITPTGETLTDAEWDTFEAALNDAIKELGTPPGRRRQIT
jgi:uncharacterized protein YicC (UPF0701 family)